MPPPPAQCTDYSLADLLAPAQWKTISLLVNETEKVNDWFTAFGKPQKNIFIIMLNLSNAKLFFFLELKIFNPFR